MQLKFKKLNPDAQLPVYATEGAAGMDLCACIPVTVKLAPGEAALVPTGLAMELSEGYEAQIRGRSGLAAKHAVFAHLGTIDSDYRGEIKVILINHAQKSFHIEPNMRIAQMVVNAAVVKCRPEFVEDIGDSNRGEGGFGSTGMGAEDWKFNIYEPITDVAITASFGNFSPSLSAVSDLEAGEQIKGNANYTHYHSAMGDNPPTVDETMAVLLAASKGKK